VDGPNKSGHDEKKETPSKNVMAALVAAIHESTFSLTGQLWPWSDIYESAFPATPDNDEIQ
jgi:hypothetical protein